MSSVKISSVNEFNVYRTYSERYLVKSVLLQTAPVDELFQIGLELRIVFPNFTKLTIICTEYRWDEVMNLCYIFQCMFDEEETPPLNPYKKNCKLIFLMLAFHSSENEKLEEFTLIYNNSLREEFLYSHSIVEMLNKCDDEWFKNYINMNNLKLKKLHFKNIFDEYCDYIEDLFPNLEDLQMNSCFLDEERSFKYLKKLSIELYQRSLRCHSDSLSFLSNLEHLKFFSKCSNIDYYDFILKHILSFTPKLKCLTLSTPKLKKLKYLFHEKTLPLPQEIIFKKVRMSFMFYVLNCGFRSKNVSSCTIILNPHDVYSCKKDSQALIHDWIFRFKNTFPQIKWCIKVYHENHESFDFFPNILFGNELI